MLYMLYFFNAICFGKIGKFTGIGNHSGIGGPRFLELVKIIIKMQFKNKIRDMSNTTAMDTYI